MLKRVLAIFVAATMCLSLFAITAFADEAVGDTSSEVASSAQHPADGEADEDIPVLYAASEGNDLLAAPAPEDGETVPALGVPTAGEPTEVAEDVDTLAATVEESTTEESTAPAKEAKSSDLSEDDKNILMLVVVVVLLVAAGVSITILSRKKKRKTK